MAVRAATKSRPEMALITLDIKNAFGTVTWADTLRQAIKHLPSIAVPVAGMYRHGHLITHVQKSDGDWTP
eukprot:11564401-Prorocentrum_lima.AAC.1